MRPKQQATTGSADLFRATLEQIINMKHELVALAGKLDWAWIDGEIAPLYSDRGRPGVETRFVIGLLLLKHIYGLSDEGVCERWVHDPYFQYFTGEEFFQHSFLHERSDLSHWRKRLGDKLELLLAESLRVAHASGALRTKDLARVTVDTTVPVSYTHLLDRHMMLLPFPSLWPHTQDSGQSLDLSWVYAELAPHYPTLGRPSVDPVLMIRMLIIGYVFGLRSERLLCRELQVNLAYRWLCKLGIEHKIPDHSAFSRARNERFRDSNIFRQVFERVVEACIAADLVGGEGFAVDASLIAADANKQLSLIHI